jgi:hypothetical protein
VEKVPAVKGVAEEMRAVGLAAVAAVVVRAVAETGA